MTLMLLAHISCEVADPCCWTRVIGEATIRPVVGRPHQTATSLRRELTSKGWIHSRGRDICPDCRRDRRKQ